jgi:predicted small lipoprotein YifL
MMRSVLVLALVVALAACGRKSMPEWPDDAVYPRGYPHTPLPEETKKKAPAPATNSAY